MNIIIGCDHAGFELKNALNDWLDKNKYTKNDVGTHSSDSVDYPDFAHKVASLIEEDETNFGILICGSANGVAMAANKHSKVRAAICWTIEIAKLSRQHNNANIICIPARFIDESMAIKMVDIFLKTPFEAGRHLTRINKIPVC